MVEFSEKRLFFASLRSFRHRLNAEFKGGFLLPQGPNLQSGFVGFVMMVLG
jgi:hypothetical protein